MKRAFPMVTSIFTTFLAGTGPTVAGFSAVSQRRTQNGWRRTSLETNLYMSLPTASNRFFDASESDGYLPKSTQPPSRFLHNDELHMHRQKVLAMRESLQHARDKRQHRRVEKLSRSILEAQQMDAEFMYQVSLERMEAATRAGLHEEAETYRAQAAEARAALPQFQLEGLWVGKYGDQFQLVNCSYVGDSLVAHKVTSSPHVPKGEVSFRVDLATSSNLEPIELDDESSQQWGSKYLQRHAGLGQVSGRGFMRNQWLDGQLILVNESYFSFAWLATGHQVFFGRPSAELVLKLLRSNDSEQRQFVARCWEETEMLEDEVEVSDGIFKSHDQQYYYTAEGCFE